MLLYLSGCLDVTCFASQTLVDHICLFKMEYTRCLLDIFITLQSKEISQKKRKSAK